MTLNNNIRQCREFKGYSQKYVASKLGKSQSTYSKIEKGSIRLSDNITEKLSTILEIPKEILSSNEELLVNHNKKNESEPPFVEINNNLLHSLVTLISDLFNQVSDNRKAIQKVEVNQKELRQQLILLVSKRIKNSSVNS